MLIQKIEGINVLRDDIYPGGTKSILMPHMLTEQKEYVYATPVYGGFQIALSQYCKKNGLKATIFCAKRAKLHTNTKTCIEAGANVIQVPYGYLSVIEKHAREYCNEHGAIKLEFGAKTDANKNILTEYAKSVFNKLGREPKEIFCAVGSGTLIESIIAATKHAKIYGIQVGKEYVSKNKRVTIMKHHLPFDKECQTVPDFPSMPNYDLKAWQYCKLYRKTDDCFFWNVL